MSLYSVRTHPAGYKIIKLTEDLEPESSYTLIQRSDDPSEYACDCPAGSRHTCRHRQMLPHFLAMKRIDTNWFLEWDQNGPLNWRQYVGPFDAIDEPRDIIEPVDDGVVRRRLK